MIRSGEADHLDLVSVGVVDVMGSAEMGLTLRVGTFDATPLNRHCLSAAAQGVGDQDDADEYTEQQDRSQE